MDEKFDDKDPEMLRMKCVDAFCIQTFQPLVSLLTHTHKVTRFILGPALHQKYDTHLHKAPSPPPIG